MKNRWKKLGAVVVGCVMASSMAFGFAACGDDPNPGPGPGGDDDKTTYVPKQGTYRTFTSTMPSNWNELTYEDNNDTQILDYLSGSLFTYDYDFGGHKFNADGSINYDAIVEGGFVTQYSAATALEDVTKTVGDKWGYTPEQKEAGGYAYKITLREDLKWNDGTAIDAGDFVYSMQQQLDPDFMNFRANTYYDTIRIINAKNYFYKNAAETYETVASQGYESNAAAIADGQTLYVNVWDLWGAQGYVDEEGNECPQWLAITDTHVYGPEGEIEKDETSGEIVYGELMAMGGYIDVGEPYESAVAIIVVNENTNVNFEDVGFYQDGKYSFVVCMEAPITLLNEDKSLHYNAAYYYSGFPLVKEDLYEANKVEPVTGSTLWTSTYDSSLASTASWGPFMLTDFQSGKSYTLSKNEHCYLFNMEENKNQYNINKIECEKIEDRNTQWMSFFSGAIDSKGLDADHLNDYKNSKYTVFSPDTGTFGLQIYGGLTALNSNDRNNSILAIPEFRQAMSLALDREYFASDVVAPNQAAYGVLNSMYYYDVEGGGVYRLTTQAKEGLLRAYGYTQESDGTWSSGNNISHYDLEDAYDTLSGANVAKAKELVKVAFEKLTAPDSGYNYDPQKPITIDVGLGANNDTYDKIYQTYKESWEAIVVGTPLEGRLNVIKSDQSDNNDWADDFRANVYDVIATGAIGGNPFNPYDLVRCYIDPNYSNLNYHTYWDTNKVDLTITFGEDDNPEYSGKTYTMSALNWWACVNGLAGSYKGQNGYDIKHTYVWSAGYLSESNRLLILAALEELIITKYQFVPLFSQYSATMLGAKFSYASNVYNQFMSFGGMRYMIVNYTDAEWDAFVATFGTAKLEEFYKASN